MKTFSYFARPSGVVFNFNLRFDLLDTTIGMPPENVAAIMAGMAQVLEVQELVRRKEQAQITREALELGRS